MKLTEIERCRVIAQARFGVDPQVTVDWSQRGMAAGYCKYLAGGNAKIRLNAKIAQAEGDSFVKTIAHEYAHVLIHNGGWTLPEWIAEGIGDVVSTLRIGDRGTRIGGDLPDRIQTLQRAAWMTFPDLFAFSLKNRAASADRESATRTSADPSRLAASSA